MSLTELAGLRRARDLIDREYAQPLDVPAMACAAHCSSSHFARRYREGYGEIPVPAPTHATRRARESDAASPGADRIEICVAVGI